MGLFLALSLDSKAQTTGYGCLIGSVVYTNYLGTNYPYGPFNGSYKVYKSTGATVQVNTNGNNGTAENYICGRINYYYWYPYGFRQEMTILSYDCVIEASLGSPAINSGSYVSYSYNNPSKCSSVPTPIDGYLWLLVPLTAVAASRFLRQRTVNLPVIVK